MATNFDKLAERIEYRKQLLRSLDQVQGDINRLIDEAEALIATARQAAGK